MQAIAIVVLVLSCTFTGCTREPAAAASTSKSENSFADRSIAVRSETTAASPDTAAAESGSAAAERARPVEMREVTLPAGTQLPLVLDTPVASDTSRVEQTVRAHIARPVVAGGVTVLPAGSAVSGVVTSAVRSGKVKGRAHVAVRFDSVTRRGDAEHYRMTTSALGRTAPATKKQDTLKVVAPAAGGAVIGRIVGGRKGALIGTGVGAGAGGAVVMSTRGKEVRLGKGTLVTVRLAEPLTIRVPRT
jgi:hypothetical protein